MVSPPGGPKHPDDAPVDDVTGTFILIVRAESGQTVARVKSGLRQLIKAMKQAYRFKLLSIHPSLPVQQRCDFVGDCSDDSVGRERWANRSTRTLGHKEQHGEHDATKRTS